MEFYDAVEPASIPMHTAACLYYDGRYAAMPTEAGLFSQVRWITVLGDYQHCGIADYERGNPVFGAAGALEAWVSGRAAMGKRARVYCNRVTLPDVRARLAGLDWLLWIATLDGDQLARDWAPNLWAVQYAGGPTAAFDTSILYGEW
jgi:hypothetical protein